MNGFISKLCLLLFLPNAFALMFHHVLINFILLLTPYLPVIYSWLCICSQLKDISLNAIMRCDCKNSTFSVRNLLPAGIKISAFFFFNSQEYHPQPCELLLALQIWIHVSVMKLDLTGKNFFSHLSKSTVVLKGCICLQSRLVEIQTNLWWHQNWITSVFNKDNGLECRGQRQDGRWGCGNDK